MSLHQKIGYGLLIIGLLRIAVPLYQTFAIFTGKAAPAQIFKTPKLPQNVNAGFDVQKQMENAFMNILPLELFNNVLNLASWLLLMLILIFGGKQIADIGIRLLKND